MNKSESKYFNTALLMDQALVELLKEKDFAYITVKEICAKAGVTRSTFYLHYETIADLVNETMEQSMQEFVSSFPVKPEEFVPGISKAPLQDLMLITTKYLRPYLTYIKEHQALYKAAFANPSALQTNTHLERVYQFVLLPILERFDVPKDEREYRMDFYIYGCMAIIRKWVEDQCRMPVEQIEKIIIRCVRPESGKSADKAKVAEHDE